MPRVPTAFLVAIGERLHALRRRQQRKQADVARHAGLDQPTLSRIERGRYPLTVEQLSALARSLDVSIYALIPWPPPDDPPT